jgi:hypothetical protein
LESRLRLRRTRNGQPITIDDVRSGAIVMEGDRLQLSIRTSRDAYLYLAFCSQRARNLQYRGLDVFPEDGGIPLIANQLTLAPARDAEIELDDQLGQEALYIILSRDELSHTARPHPQFAGSRSCEAWKGSLGLRRSRWTAQDSHRASSLEWWPSWIRPNVG